jgi:hypothetical protein
MALINGIPSSVNPNTRIKGFDIVMSNLNKEIRAIEGRTMAGLIKAASYIRRDMDRTPPLIPVKTGNMRSSWQITPLPESAFPGGYGPVLKMGFNANYSLWVHEMLDSDINWTRKNSGPKFFEYSIKRNKDKVLQIIRDNVQIK